jgi:5-methylthioribose kinase
MTPGSFEVARPGGWFLTPEPEALGARLRGYGLDLGPLAVEVAGDGNMNCVLRATGPGGSVVVKQARPWVEKYPQIAAPVERSHVEAAFYRAVAGIGPVASRMPACLASDPDSAILVLEDLGPTSDFTAMYRGQRLVDANLADLCDWLAALHALAPVDPVFANRDMKALQHAHVFDLPFRPTSLFDLDARVPGLARVRAAVVDDALRSALSGLGVQYLGGGGSLLHGDFHPGSWARARGRLWVLDPEFAFVGDPAYDVGVLLAHLVFSGEDPDAAVSRLRARGVAVGALTLGFAGAEILRRLFGAAWLPFPSDVDTLDRWARVGRSWSLSR